ncbi:hypothetical protein [uncultured Chryseobacterium sp.]|uniref:hypothetical protein n=1 Tax=uncultured Chryseobacterium sp. TaxID=259322 RepID=UPI0025D7A0FC|nr:hypothetical protein [uncultured Chryseobacterium sp.]
MSEYFQLQKKIEEKVIEENMHIYLNRAPTNEDKIKTKKILHPTNQLQYLLAYEDDIVGMITRSYDGTKYSVAFDDKKKNF